MSCEGGNVFSSKGCCPPLLTRGIEGASPATPCADAIAGCRLTWSVVFCVARRGLAELVICPSQTLY